MTQNDNDSQHNSTNLLQYWVVEYFSEIESARLAAMEHEDVGDIEATAIDRMFFDYSEAKTFPQEQEETYGTASLNAHE